VLEGLPSPAWIVPQTGADADLGGLPRSIASALRV
jgi:hypothetical protein